MQRIIRLILILCICSPNACRSRNDEILTKTILSDIRNAFKSITNDSHRLNQIIPEMYAPIMQLLNSTFVFQLPCAASNDDHPTTVMLAMQRDDFAEPTFPNLTTQYMTEIQKRRQQQLHYAESMRPDRTKYIEGDSGDAAGTSDWSVLGLHGWTGEITLPIKELEMNHKTGGKYGIKDNAYPTYKIFMDFTKGEIDAFINDIDTTENGAYEDNHDQQAAVAVLKENNENVYIARVNDPFGYSTKWFLRNSTQITPQQPTNYATVMPTMDERPKRDVVKLYSMIKCSTSCEPLAYKGYGCYCGFSGAGVPVDGIDRCCKLHDKCYEYSNCISYLEYFVPYIWKCYRGKPLCAIDHGEWGGPQSCAARLCRCDLRLSRCLRQYTCPQRRRAVCTSSFARRLQHLLLYK